MGKILVTGATGNVGKYVCSAISDIGHSVLAAVIEMSEKELSKIDKRAEPVLFDFENDRTFEKALTGVDRVFLMRPPHLGNPEDLKPFIRRMKQTDIRLVTFLSLMGIEHNPIPPHYKIEKYIEETGIPYAHIRPSFFMQNLTGVHLKEIQENGEIFIPAGRSRCSFIDAKDIGLVVANLLTNPEKYSKTTHTVTGPESLDYYQIADIFTKVLGRRIIYHKPSIFEFRNQMQKRGFDKKYISVTTMLYLMTRLGTANKVTADFERIIGKKPRSFEIFAAENKKIFIER